MAMKTATEIEAALLDTTVNMVKLVRTAKRRTQLATPEPALPVSQSGATSSPAVFVGNEPKR